jgi:hypothetical protein
MRGGINSDHFFSTGKEFKMSSPYNISALENPSENGRARVYCIVNRIMPVRDLLPPFFKLVGQAAEGRKYDLVVDIRGMDINFAELVGGLGIALKFQAGDAGTPADPLLVEIYLIGAPEVLRMLPGAMSQVQYGGVKKPVHFLNDPSELPA